MTEDEIIKIIEKDPWMMDILATASALDLKDWLIGAGFVRNKVWDHLSGRHAIGVDTSDIDLVYYDPNGNDQEADEELSRELRDRTGLEWEVVNEVYAHKWNNLPPYRSTKDAISQWPETVTALGVTLCEKKIQLFAPYGITDLVNFVVRPTPLFSDKIDVIKERVQKKRWLEKWPNIKIVENDAIVDF